MYNSGMSSLLDLFVPREKKFFEKIDIQIKLLADASNKLKLFRKNTKNTKKILTTIHDYTEKSEAVSMDIMLNLRETFITPIDREDIQNISASLDRAINSLEKVASSILCYHLSSLDKCGLQQIVILQKSIVIIQEIFQKPLNTKINNPLIEEVKHLERLADKLFRDGLLHLFSTNSNPMQVIRYKNVYESIEDAIDDIRSIANILEKVLMMNS